MGEKELIRNEKLHSFSLGMREYRILLQITSKSCEIVIEEYHDDEKKGQIGIKTNELDDFLFQLHLKKDTIENEVNSWISKIQEAINFGA